jgi:hypothetical protein
MVKVEITWMNRRNIIHIVLQLLFGKCSDKIEDRIKINLKELETREKRELGTYWYGFEDNIKIYINE